MTNTAWAILIVVAVAVAIGARIKSRRRIPPIHEPKPKPPGDHEDI